MIDESRKRKELSLDALQEESGFDPAERADQQMVLQVDINDLIAKIQTLDEPYREVLILRFVNNLPPREIGKITNSSAGVVSVRIHRAVIKLKKIVKDHEKKT